MTMLWSALGIRCHCCKLPIYLYWSLGFPKGRERRRFDSLARCPYCGDDGTGETGDCTYVDPASERRQVTRNLLFSGLILLAGFFAIVLAMAYGYLPS
jgi:hypothetical protein